MSALKTASCLRNIQPEYIDVDVYIQEEDGAEWNFSIFKCLETDRVCFGDYRWAANKDDSFEETDKLPSVEVWAAVIEEMPNVLKIIQEALTKDKTMNTNWIIVKGNPIDGFDYVGPFPNAHTAGRYIEEDIESENQWIVELAVPCWNEEN